MCLSKLEKRSTKLGQLGSRHGLAVPRAGFSTGDEDGGCADTRLDACTQHPAPGRWGSGHECPRPLSPQWLPAAPGAPLQPRRRLTQAAPLPDGPHPPGLQLEESPFVRLCKHSPRCWQTPAPALTPTAPKHSQPGPKGDGDGAAPTSPLRLGSVHGKGRMGTWVRCDPTGMDRQTGGCSADNSLMARTFTGT